MCIYVYLPPPFFVGSILTHDFAKAARSERGWDACRVSRAAGTPEGEFHLLEVRGLWLPLVTSVFFLVFFSAFFLCVFCSTFFFLSCLYPFFSAGNEKWNAPPTFSVFSPAGNEKWNDNQFFVSFFSAGNEKWNAPQFFIFSPVFSFCPQAMRNGMTPSFSFFCPQAMRNGMTPSFSFSRKHREGFFGETVADYTA